MIANAPAPSSLPARFWLSVRGSLPLLVLNRTAQRFFLAGMTAGSVKC